MWKCTQPFLEFPVVPRATMNESEHINIFSRHKSYIFFTERNFCRGVIQIYFQQPEEDLDLDLLVPDYSQQVCIILLTRVHAAKFHVCPWSTMNKPVEVWPVPRIFKTSVWTMGYILFLMSFLPQQIEGIEAMLDDQAADQGQVNNSLLTPIKKRS